MTKLTGLTFITTSFHDQSWIRLQLQRIRENTPAEIIERILIVDQDRTPDSKNCLLKLDDQVEVFQYEKSLPHFRVAEHDHPAVLNRVIKEVRSDYCCILDSDAHPITPNWVNLCKELLDQYDAILAQDPQYPWVSHPCFMLLRREHLSLIDFSEGFLVPEFDTGRLVSRQLRRAGLRACLVSQEKAFQGEWGHIYLKSIYHHGSGSFQGGGEVLRSQYSWQNKYYQRGVLRSKTSYTSSLNKKFWYRVLNNYHFYNARFNPFLHNPKRKVVLPPYYGPLSCRE